MQRAALPRPGCLLQHELAQHPTFFFITFLHFFSADLQNYVYLCEAKRHLAHERHHDS